MELGTESTVSSYLFKVTHHDNPPVSKVDTEHVAILPAKLIKRLNCCHSKVAREGKVPEDGQWQEGTRGKTMGDTEAVEHMEEDGQQYQDSKKS